MRNTEKAFKWIVGILRKHNVSFQITGGLAAKVYGSKRLLNDIDIDIPDADFAKILEDVKQYITFGPSHYRDERWDCMLMTINFEGQDIDITGADSIKICDARTGKWQNMSVDVTNSANVEVLGLIVPVISKENLVAYKSMLAGQYQQKDIQAILISRFRVK